MGVAGFIGAGKSSVASILVEMLNAQLLDCDLIAKELMESSSQIKQALHTEFNVVTDGVINYAELGAIVFSNSAALHKLNAIVHPPLIVLLNDKISAVQSNVVLDAALIPLWQDKIMLDLALWVDAEKELRISRLKKRNGYSREEALSRIDGQLKLLKEPSIDHVFWLKLDNNSEKDTLDIECQALFKRLLNNGGADA